MSLKESARNLFFRRKQERISYDPNARGRAYFRALKEMYPELKTIYYPGVGDDYETFYGLENDFQIITLDHENGWSTYLRSRREFPNYVKGDFEKSPFKDESFDAVFVQDADSAEFGDVFRTLKTGGIFIFSGIDCGPLFNLTHTDFDKVENLRRVEMPDFSISYHSFEKTGPVTQKDIDRIDKEHKWGF